MEKKELKESLEYYRDIDENPLMVDKISNLIDLLDTLEIIQNLLIMIKLKS